MPPAIELGQQPSHHEVRAAEELRRYWHQLTGEVVGDDGADGAGGDDGADGADGQRILIGVAGAHAELDELVAAGTLTRPRAAESYAVRTVGDRVAVLGADPLGALYGTYRLLTTLGIRFYLNRDVLPSKVPTRFPSVDLVEAPAVSRRGLLPWHDFLNGPSAYGFAEFRRYLDQMLKMRMNTLVLHNYSRGYPTADINEPFLQFTHNGVGFDGYLDTSVDNVRWGLAPTRADDLAFDAGDALTHDVVASDVARFTDRQPDARENTFAKGKILIQRVLAYAQRWGMEVVLGTDFDLVPQALEDAGCDALDPATLHARVDDIVATYPTLRYLQLYYSESHHVTTEQAITAYAVVRDYLARVAPAVTLLTGSWFQEERFTQMDGALSSDIAFSSLLPHDMTVKPDWAKIAPRRAAWAIPWIEVDGGLCEPQLALRTMAARLPELRSAGVDAVIGILWRERPVEVNVAYLADDLWRSGSSGESAAAYYQDYAATLFGSDLAASGAALLADVEQAGVYGKRTTTPQFYGTDGVYDGETTPEFGGWFFGGDEASLSRSRRWERIADGFDELLRSAGAERARDELGHWRDTARWMQWYWRAHHDVPTAAAGADAEAAWQRLQGSGFREAIAWHVAMVRDLPMLGGLLSAAGGRWYYGTHDHASPTGRKHRESYRWYEQQVLDRLPVRPPVRLSARRTASGVRLRWPAEPDAAYLVYRTRAGAEPECLTPQAIPGGEFTVDVDAAAEYTVRTVADDGAVSAPSPAARVAAADGAALRLLVLPQAQTAVRGQSVAVSATVLSERSADRLTATLRYRGVRDSGWRVVAMRPAVIGRRNTFWAEIPGSVTATGSVVYTIEATDGHATASYPTQRGELAAVTCLDLDGEVPGAPTEVRVANGRLTWAAAAGAVTEYRIFATHEAAQPDSAADYVTYVPARQLEFVLPDAIPPDATVWVQAADRAGATGRAVAAFR